MESKIEKESLYECLNVCLKNELPEEYKDEGKNNWARAIVHVVKCDNSNNYAVALNDGYGKPSIIKDFGNMAAIVRIDRIHVVDPIYNSMLPDLRNHSQIAIYLENMGEDIVKVKTMLSAEKLDGSSKTDEEKKKDRADVKAMVIRHAIREHMEKYTEFTTNKES